MTMPYMGDCLLPPQQRDASDKYRRLRGYFNPYRRFRAELVEVRAMQLTPGMMREPLDILMGWPRDMQQRTLSPLVELDEEALPLARANAEGATLEDGEAMLRAILEHRPKFGRYVPLYVTRYLQYRRGNGCKSESLAKEFGTTPERIARWWRQETFDPLTGEQRDPETIRRGKPVHRSNTGVLAI